MAINSYRKLTKGPLGLGRGLTITDDTFTDKGFNDVNKKKLKAALRVNLAEEIDAKAVNVDKANTAEARIIELEGLYTKALKDLQEAENKLADLQEGDTDAWLTMSAKELAKAYTIPELRKLIKDEFPEYDLGRGLKEAALTKIIVDCIAEANAEFDAITGFNAEGFNAEGFNAEGFNAEGNKA